MITKDQLAAQMIRECEITQHLFTKFTTEGYDYRPSPNQRTTLDLLRYLSYCGIGGVRSLAEADWTIFGSYAAEAEAMPAEGFPAAMDQQKADLQAFFAGVSEEALETQDAPAPGAGTQPLGVAILGGPLTWLAAYKLQLFLYAKAAGATDIGTANAWAGVDWSG